MVDIKKEWEKHKASKGITKEEIEQSNKLSNLIKEKLDNEPKLTQEQRQAIKLRIQNKLPELATQLEKEGRSKYLGNVFNEILNNENKAELLEEELIEKGKHNKLLEKNKEKNKKENKIYLLKTNVISYIAKKERRQATELIVDYIKEENFIYTIKDDIKSEK